MGRYTKKHASVLSNLNLHYPEEHTSVALKTCTICGMDAITEDELELFIVSGSHGVRSNYCTRCFNSVYNIISNPKRQGYKGTRVPVEVERTGVCRQCGLFSVEETAPLHHYLYDDNKYSIELCTRCHTAADADRRRFERLIKMLEDGHIKIDEIFSNLSLTNAESIQMLKDDWIAHYQSMSPPNVHSPPKLIDVGKLFE